MAEEVRFFGRLSAWQNWIFQRPNAVGAEGALKETFGTTCHGAGRVMSRTAARKSPHAQGARERLAELGIIVRSETRDGISEEIPEAYKDVDAVIDVVHNAGLSRRVARLKPIGVIKG